MALSSGLLFLAGVYVMVKRVQGRRLYAVTIVAIGSSLGLTMAFVALPKDSALAFTLEAGSWLMLRLWMIWLSLSVQDKQRRG